MDEPTPTPTPTPARSSPLEVLAVTLRLGLTSFGGPVAHFGYYREEYVKRRRWLDEATFADLVALCQFLPGPASTQVTMAVGLMRGGFIGMLAAWLGFVTPSAIIMVLFAYGVEEVGGALHSGWLHGLKVVAVAVVAQAVLGMMRSLAPDRERATLAVVAAAIVLWFPTALGQIGAILLGVVVGALLLKNGADTASPAKLPIEVSRWTGAALLAAFLVLVIGLPFAASAVHNQGLNLAAAFYRAGSLVFGGGHVVLPLLQASVVPPGWVTNDAFLAGYGAAQALPGPLFTFAAYLGAVMGPAPNGWLGGVICLVAIFLPSFLLIGGMLPFWDSLRRLTVAQLALRGVNAAVVGLLLAALYRPVWTSAIMSPTDVALAMAAFLALFMWKLPPWLVVLLSAIGGWLISA
ncbi:MAG: chromate efflux transporter [Pseudolabrys sp.]